VQPVVQQAGGLGLTLAPWPGFSAQRSSIQDEELLQHLYIIYRLVCFCIVFYFRSVFQGNFEI
jgi:hypothetical protein